MSSGLPLPPLPLERNDMSIDRRLKIVGNSSPIDRQTAISVSGGVAYEPCLKYEDACFSECPEILPIPKNQPEFTDLTGTRKGLIRVIGYGGSGNGGSKWICMCACGRYQMIGTKALKRVRDKQPLLCQVCDNIRAVRDFGKDSRFANR